VDAYGLSFAQKAMIRCGLLLDVNGIWHEEQLTPDLQSIIAKYRDHFNGLLVPKFEAFPMLQSVNIEVIDGKEHQEEIEEKEKDSFLEDIPEIEEKEDEEE
jgi:hypothetical protein